MGYSEHHGGVSAMNRVGFMVTAFILAVVLGGFALADITPYDDYDFRDYYSLYNALFINGSYAVFTELSGSLAWGNVTGFPTDYMDNTTTYALFNTKQNNLTSSWLSNSTIYVLLNTKQSNLTSSWLTNSTIYALLNTKQSNLTTSWLFNSTIYALLNQKQSNLTTSWLSNSTIYGLLNKKQANLTTSWLPNSTIYTLLNSKEDNTTVLLLVNSKVSNSSLDDNDCSAGDFVTSFDSSGVPSCDTPSYIADTNADTECSGSTTYLDGNGNCDDISGVYVQASDWTTIDNYPSACSAGEYVSAVGDTLTCSAPSGGDGGWVGTAESDLNMSEYSIYNATSVSITGDDVYIGSADQDHSIWFYEDSDPEGERIFWDYSTDQFIITDDLDVSGSINSDSYIRATSKIFTIGDIYTTGSGDDIWAGSSTKANAGVQIEAEGDINMTGNITMTSGTNLVNMYFDGDDFVIEKVS